MQKEACQTIIDAKDRRIREFETELKNKNEESALSQGGRFSVSMLRSGLHQSHVSLICIQAQQFPDMIRSFAENFART